MAELLNSSFVPKEPLGKVSSLNLCHFCSAKYVSFLFIINSKTQKHTSKASIWILLFVILAFSTCLCALFVSAPLTQRGRIIIYCVLIMNRENSLFYLVKTVQECSKHKMCFKYWKCI